MKKCVSVFLVLMLMVTLLAGCGASSKEPSSNEPSSNEANLPQASNADAQSEATDAVDVAFVTYMTGIPYMDNAWAGAYEAANALGLSVGYYGPASNDTAG